MANLFQRLVLPLQSEMPMLPFLYDFLADLMTNLMEIVVKTDILESLSAVRLCSFDINDNTVLKKKAETKIGTGAHSALNKTIEIGSSNPTIRNEFFRECQNFVKGCVTKLQGKNPLKFKIVRNSCCFLPKRMVEEPEKVLSSGCSTTL